MKKILCILFVFTSIIFAKESLKVDAKSQTKENERLQVDAKAQAKADQQLKLQNKNVIRVVLEEYKRKLPQKVDKYTSFVDISSKDLTLIYTYEINTGAKSDQAVKKEDTKRMSKVVKYGICTSARKFLESDININYIYKSKTSKKELFNFYVTLEDCKNITL